MGAGVSPKVLPSACLPLLPATYLQLQPKCAVRPVHFAVADAQVEVELSLCYDSLSGCSNEVRYTAASLHESRRGSGCPRHLKLSLPTEHTRVELHNRHCRCAGPGVALLELLPQGCHNRRHVGHLPAHCECWAPNTQLLLRLPGKEVVTAVDCEPEPCTVHRYVLRRGVERDSSESHPPIAIGHSHTALVVKRVNVYSSLEEFEVDRGGLPRRVAPFLPVLDLELQLEAVLLCRGTGQSAHDKDRATTDDAKLLSSVVVRVNACFLPAHEKGAFTVGPHHLQAAFPQQHRRVKVDDIVAFRLHAVFRLYVVFHLCVVFHSSFHQLCVRKPLLVLALGHLRGVGARVRRGLWYGGCCWGGFLLSGDCTTRLDR
eukprot:2273611-Prymnesium_polylepis.1